jgi:hypothetical protein
MTLVISELGDGVEIRNHGVRNIFLTETSVDCGRETMDCPGKQLGMSLLAVRPVYRIHVSLFIGRKRLIERRAFLRLEKLNIPCFNYKIFLQIS